MRTEQARLARRRPGIFPGRRFAFVLAVAGVTVASSGGVAVADETVVSATVYSGSSGGVPPASVTLSALDNCPQYSGSDPVFTYPGQSPVYPVLGSSWALETVITCALHIPLSNVSGVQVYNPSSNLNGGYEASLTSVQLSDPTQWDDPNAPGALPLIFVDGSENQNTYFRPLARGGDNAIDEVTVAAPIAIVVNENGSQLTVAATKQQLSSTSFQFSATVTGPTGTPVPAASLTWSWSFGDGSPSSLSASPTHVFAQGNYPVTLQVSDNARGLGGTDTIDVQVGSPPSSGGTPQNGGTPKSPGKSPLGPSKSSGRTPRGRAGKSNHPAGSGKAHGTKPASQANRATTTGAATTVAAASSPSAATGTSRPTAAVHRHATPVKRPAAAAARSLLVAGRLLGSVTPLPSSQSPLVHPVPRTVASAPAVRRAVSGSTSAATGIAAGLGVVLLFGLGAGSELRWRRDWRLPRLRR